MDVRRLDPLAAEYALTGFLFFMSVNLNMFIATGAGFADEPTAPGSVSPLQTFRIGDYDDMQATWSNVLGAFERIAFYATRGLPEGVSYIKRSDYRLIHVTAVAPTSPGPDLHSDYFAVFGVDPSVDELVGWKAKVIGTFFDPSPWAWFQARAPNS